MKILILDGHPDEGRLVTHLLDHYAASAPAGAEVERVAMRDLAYDPNLGQGYGAPQPWEPDLERLAAALDACDHLVIGFPLWWGAEPAQLKGLIDRVITPGFAFRYHKGDAFWDRLLAGRSADVIITMDTPPWYLKWQYGDPVGRRWKKQVLEFVGFKPVRFFYFGPTRRGGAKKDLSRWLAAAAKAARTAPSLKRPAKLPASARTSPAEALAERKS